MADLSRVPIKNGEFDTYIRTTTDWLFANSPVQSELFIPQRWNPAPPGVAMEAPVPVLLKNWQRLWLLETEANSWRSQRDQWIAIYTKYSNPDVRTRVITKDKETVLDAFTQFAEPLNERIAASPYITNEDRAIFRIKQRSKTRKHHTAPIEDFPEFTMHGIGSGEIKFSVRGTHDGDRASKLAGTQIEVGYIILIPDVPRPTNASELTQSFISTKAIFTHNFGAQNQGKLLFAACRWIVATDPARNGPWSNIQTILVG